MQDFTQLERIQNMEDSTRIYRLYLQVADDKTGETFDQWEQKLKASYKDYSERAADCVTFDVWIKRIIEAQSTIKPNEKAIAAGIKRRVLVVGHQNPFLNSCTELGKQTYNVQVMEPRGTSMRDACEVLRKLTDAAKQINPVFVHDLELGKNNYFDKSNKNFKKR